MNADIQVLIPELVAARLMQLRRLLVSDARHLPLQSKPWPICISLWQPPKMF
jgi:hypothetical protein